MLKKKTRRLFASFALLSAAAICSVSAFAGCSSCNSDEEQTGYRPESPSVSESVPEDGSTPDNYDALQNVAYVIGKLNSRSYYHSENVNTASAAVLGFITVEQNVVGSKDYYNGILITSTISIGSTFAPSKAIQKYYGNGEVIIRTAASSNKNDWDGLNTEWSTDAPSEILSEDEYTERYGLWATEFSDYVINEDTVASSSMTTDGDNYVVTLNFVVSGENDATYYYKKQMVTMGELSEQPEFEYATMTITFSSDWTVLSYSTEEQYTSKKGITATVTGTATTTFSYDEEDVDVSAYEEYFKNYENSSSEHLTAQDYLDRGLSSVLNGETLAMSAYIGDTSISGYIRMTGTSASSVNTFMLNAGGMQLTVDGSGVYVTIGGTTVMYGIESSAVSITGDSYSLSQNGDLTVEARITVADLISIPVTFSFTVEDDEVTYVSAAGSSDLNGVTLSIAVEPTTDSVSFVEDYADNAADIAPFVGDLLEGIANGELVLSADIDYTSDSLAISGSAAVDVFGSEADIQLVITAEESSYYLHITFVDGRLYATLSNSQMDADSALKLTVSANDIGEAVSQLSPVLSLLGIDFSSFELQDDSIIATLVSAVGNLTVSGSTDNDGNNVLVFSDILSVAVVKNNAPVIAAPENTEDYIDLAFISDLAEDLTDTLLQSIYGYDLSGSVYVNLLGTTDLFDFDISAKIAYYDQELVAVIDLDVSAVAENIYYGDAQTQIVIKSGIVYITKTQTTEQIGTKFVELDEYLVYSRAMTLEYFISNIYEELLFALNINQTSLESSISAALEMVSGMTGDGDSSYDFGDLIGISAEDGTYSVTVDIAKLLGFEEGTVQVDIKDAEVEGTSVISEINISVDLSMLFYGVIPMDVVSGSISITNNNPGQTVDVSCSADSISAVIEALGYDSEEAFLSALENSGCLSVSVATEYALVA